VPGAAGAAAARFHVLHRASRPTRDPPRRRQRRAPANVVRSAPVAGWCESVQSVPTTRPCGCQPTRLAGAKFHVLHRRCRGSRGASSPSPRVRKEQTASVQPSIAPRWCWRVPTIARSCNKRADHGQPRPGTCFDRRMPYSSTAVSRLTPGSPERAVVLPQAGQATGRRQAPTGRASSSGRLVEARATASQRDLARVDQTPPAAATASAAASDAVFAEVDAASSRGSAPVAPSLPCAPGREAEIPTRREHSSPAGRRDSTRRGGWPDAA
jgi:hypothetical protein